MSPSYLEIPNSMSTVDEEQVSMLASVEEESGDSLLKELVETFIRDNECRFEMIAESCQKKDLQSLRQHTHFICGSTANLGIARVAQLCRQVEKAIIDGRFDAFDSFPLQLKEEYQVGMEDLKKRAGF